VWYLEELPMRGGMLGSTAPNTFEGHGFATEEDLFIRETTQNAIDNPSTKEAKPRVVVRTVNIAGPAKKLFLKSVDFKALYANSQLIARTPQFSELRTVSSDKPSGLLYFEDFNTTGLDGSLDDPRGNWMRFNLHGDATKLEEAEKIGSYGYGKSVLSRAAGTNTFIVYTAFTDGGGKLRARLMGHTFQPWFNDGSVNRTGRGWLCKEVNSSKDPLPYEDDDAHNLASSLGFSSRKAGQTGTSFLLIGNCPAKTPITIPAIRRAFETWWWPSILDNRLDIELWEDGIRVSDPSPRLRSDLAPYISCKGKLDGAAGNDVQVFAFERAFSRDMGRLALTLAVDEQIFDNPLHSRAPGPRRVARMRTKSGMVTEYREFGTQKRLSFVGFYLGSKDIDDALKFAEPKEHDTWSPMNQRLSRVPNGRNIVEALQTKTQTSCYNFQRNHSETKEPSVDRLPQLERLLGAAFKQKDGSATRRAKGGSTRTSRLTVVDYPDSPNNSITPIFGASSNRLDFLIRYTLRPSVSTKKKIRAWIDLNVAEEAQGAKGAAVTIDVIDQLSKKSCLSKGSQNSFDITLEPGKPRVFRVKSAEYPKHQVLLLTEGESAVTEKSDA
jgi:hypothetical protein